MVVVFIFVDGDKATNANLKPKAVEPRLGATLSSVHIISIPSHITVSMLTHPAMCFIPGLLLVMLVFDTLSSFTTGYLLDSCQFYHIFVHHLPCYW